MYNSFFTLLFRTKNIKRWSLMYNTQTEDLMQHTAECAYITHYLAVIGNAFFNKHYNAENLAVCAMFHDVPEVLTGDLPTPVKYFNDDMHRIYKEIEAAASEKLLNHLPSELQGTYSAFFRQSDLTAEEKSLIKIADKLCAYIKCIQEINVGNREFQSAYEKIKYEIENTENDELKYFLENCIYSFSLSIDDIKGMI